MNTLATRACLLLLAGLGLFLNGCKSDVWCDSSGLCWQAEQYQYGNKDFGGFVPAEAAAYCDALVLDGHDDWRLPTINELRSIAAGNADVMTGGACNVIDGSVTSDGFNPACLGAEKYRGPSDEGCYWNRALDGSCDTPDLGSVGRPLETWAMNPASNNPEQWVAYIGFDSATLGFNDSCSLGEVRCVRGKPADCLINGQPCTSYFPSRSFCDQDLSAQADSIELTIRVPEKLAYQPYQILAFLYEADNFSFPPLGPPDAGTDYNQLIQPQIDIDTPLTMTIPATTFYREELVSGNFRLYVGLQMNEKYPPIPSSEDYIWGDNQAAIALPINGIEHTGASIPMDITLEAVGCGGSTPFACADGSCAIDASACPASECDPIPTDNDVLSCRWVSSFVEDNCADFPISEGWTNSSVADFCAAQSGAVVASVSVSQGQSCLQQKGGFSAASRCTMQASDNDPKTWYGFGIPKAVCELVQKGLYESGPFCQSY